MVLITTNFLPSILSLKKQQAKAPAAPAVVVDASPENLKALEDIKARLVELKKKPAAERDTDAIALAVVELKRLKAVCGEVDDKKKSKK